MAGMGMGFVGLLVPDSVNSSPWIGTRPLSGAPCVNDHRIAWLKPDFSQSAICSYKKTWKFLLVFPRRKVENDNRMNLTELTKGGISANNV